MGFGWFEPVNGINNGIKGDGLGPREGGLLPDEDVASRLEFVRA